MSYYLPSEDEIDREMRDSGLDRMQASRRIQQRRELASQSNRCRRVA